LLLWYLQTLLGNDLILLLSLRGCNYVVVLLQEKPFTMLSRDYENKKGNDRFEGYSVDLIDEVAKMLDFKYEIYLVHDGLFGTKNPDGRWNGMIGELRIGVGFL
jgi:hypothetical protein